MARSTRFPFFPNENKKRKTRTSKQRCTRPRRATHLEHEVCASESEDARLVLAERGPHDPEAQRNRLHQHPRHRAVRRGDHNRDHDNRCGRAGGRAESGEARRGEARQTHGTPKRRMLSGAALVCLLPLLAGFVNGLRDTGNDTIPSRTSKNKAGPVNHSCRKKLQSVTTAGPHSQRAALAPSRAAH